MSTMRKSPSESEPGIADQGYLHVVTSDPASLPDLDLRNALARVMMATVREPLVFLDSHLRIVAASRSYSQMFPAQPPHALDRPFCEFKSLCWDNSVLDLLQAVAALNVVVED